ncbi:MAG: hypothetical protein PHT69_09345 [Bacteroidales bacterium]|nr:hypothetical protein [Bacteroidales bacterium]
MQRLIFIFFLFFSSIQINYAQSLYNFTDVDSLTYRFYNEQKWDSLILFSKQAIENNIDYYYLRMRTGIAYYELKSFRKSAKQFEQALKFNSVDVVASEYLYFSYIFSGQNEKAVLLSNSFPLSLKEKLKLDKFKLIDEVYIEGGPTLGNNPYIERNGPNNNQNIILKEDELTNDVRYFSLGLRHRLTKRISIFHSASTIDIGKTQIFDVYDGQITNDYRIFQRQYYINAGIYLGKGFIITPAYHLINVNYDKLEFSFDNNDKLFLEQINYNPNEHVFSLSLKKDIGNFDVTLNGSYAKLNNNIFTQEGITFTFFPKSNLNYYINLPFVFQQNSMRQNIIIDPMIGIRLNNKIWVEGNYTFGHLNNYVEKNAYIVYNINDNILSRKGLSLLFNINKNIQFSLIYQHLKKENTRLIVEKDKEPKIINTKYFINHTIIGGIKWTL